MQLTAVANWVETRTACPVSSVGLDEFLADLKDGSTLCLLANAIEPGAIKKIKRDGGPYFTVLNVKSFLRWGKDKGLRPHQLFNEVDLNGQGDGQAVVKCLAALIELVDPSYGGGSTNDIASQSDSQTVSSSTSRRKSSSSSSLEQASMGSSNTEDGDSQNGGAPRKKSSKLLAFMQTVPPNSVVLGAEAGAESSPSTPSPPPPYKAQTSKEEPKASPVIRSPARLWGKSSSSDSNRKSPKTSTATSSNGSSSPRSPPRTNAPSVGASSVSKAKAFFSQIVSSSSSSSLSSSAKPDPQAIVEKEGEAPQPSVSSPRPANGTPSPPHPPARRPTPSKLTEFLSAVPGNVTEVARVAPTSVPPPVPVAMDKQLPRVPSTPPTIKATTPKEAPNTKTWPPTPPKAREDRSSPRADRLRSPLGRDRSHTAGTEFSESIQPDGDYRDRARSYGPSGDLPNNVFVKQSSGMENLKLAHFIEGYSGAPGEHDWYSLYVEPSNESPISDAATVPYEDVDSGKDTRHHTPRGPASRLRSVLELEGELSRINQERDALMAELEAVKDRTLHLERSVDDINDHIDKFQQEFVHRTSMVVSQLQANGQDHNSGARREDSSLQEDVYMLVERMALREKEMEEMKHEMKQFARRQREEVADLKLQLRAARDDVLAEMREKLEELSKENKELQSSQTKLQQQVRTLRADIAEKDIEIQSMRAKVQQISLGSPRTSLARRPSASGRSSPPVFRGSSSPPRMREEGLRQYDERSSPTRDESSLPLTPPAVSNLSRPTVPPTSKLAMFMSTVAANDQF